MRHETCPLLEELSWIQHGFFNRYTPVDAGLADIQYFSATYKRVRFLPQRHTDISVTLMEPAPQQGADACYTSPQDRVDREVALAVKTADCCPVLLACTKSKQIAAIHAGWHGALSNIVKKTIHKMILDGAEPTRMIAAIGPHLHVDNFHVREDLYNRFAAEQPESLSHFIPHEDHWNFDLSGLVGDQLRYMGVFHIWQSAHDTFSNPDYFSWRKRDNDPESETGRNVSIINKINT